MHFIHSKCPRNMFQFRRRNPLTRTNPDDGEYIANSAIINGAACHGIHHEKFEYNYGQFTTIWDRLGGSYRRPGDVVFQRGKTVAGVEVESKKGQ